MNAGHHAGDEERHVKEQVEPERGAEELGDVGRHRDELRLHPHHPGQPARVVRAEALGQVAVGDDPELGREVLDQHRHQVRGEDDPEQQVAEAGAALDVGREVARVDVGDRGDERRAEHHQRRAQPAAAEQRFERGDARLARLDGSRAWRPASRGSPRASRARVRRQGRAPRRRRGRRTVRRTAARSTSSSRVPGDDPALAEEAQHCGIGVRDTHEGRHLARLELGERRCGRSRRA